MATPSRAAFFYQDPRVLDREAHKDLRFQAVPGYAFASQNHVLPVVLNEFAQACLEYPIVFSAENPENIMSLALTGIEPGKNLLIDAKHQWGARYIPASVRRYPFVLADIGEKSPPTVAVDMAAAHFGSEGEPLFLENGEPAEITKRASQMLAQYHQQTQLTRQFLQTLHQMDLLTQTALNADLASGQKVSLTDVWIVDERKLQELTADRLHELNQKRYLAPIFAHLLSLRNLMSLASKLEPKKTARTRKKA